ncbi:MAG TPA: ABC transporter ATP-binding protein [Ktedonobacterales bacterium]
MERLTRSSDAASRAEMEAAAFPSQAEPITARVVRCSPLSGPIVEEDMFRETLPLVSARRLTRVYTLGQTRVPALRGVSLDISAGEFVAITGHSGSGKSTLMSILGLLDTPDGGRYWLGGREVSRLAPDTVADIRNSTIGFVFQGFNLLPRATALTNVALPLLYAGMAPEERRRRAIRALRLVGLGDRMDHRPTQLSGGQQQRVAIARALVNRPKLLLADEPTGNLDTQTSVEIMSVLQQLNGAGLTIILVTHETDIAQYAQRQIKVQDGAVASDAPIIERRFAAVELGRATDREGTRVGQERGAESVAWASEELR